MHWADSKARVVSLNHIGIRCSGRCELKAGRGGAVGGCIGRAEIHQHLVVPPTLLTDLRHYPLLFDSPATIAKWLG